MLYVCALVSYMLNNIQATTYDGLKSRDDQCMLMPTGGRSVGMPSLPDGYQL